MKFDIWQEGFMVQGMHEPMKAQKIASQIEADNFEDACEKFIHGSDKHSLNYYDRNKNTYYGCHLFNNKEEAIKAFG